MSNGPREIFEAILESRDGDSVVLATPTNSYRLHFVLEPASTTCAVGDRISGTAHARALKVHRAGAGGAFIEPVHGQPRIVAGRVLRHEGHCEILVRSAIPMLVTVEREQDQEVCVPGEFINFHVESGAVFRAVPS